MSEVALGNNQNRRVTRKAECFDGVAYIPLTRHKTAIVDADLLDTPLLYQWPNKGPQRLKPSDLNWYADKREGIWYARSELHAGRRNVHLHRLITECAPSEIVKHIDGDRLNNLRENLEVCSHAEYPIGKTKSKKHPHRRLEVNITHNGGAAFSITGGGEESGGRLVFFVR